MGQRRQLFLLPAQFLQRRHRWQPRRSFIIRQPLLQPPLTRCRHARSLGPRLQASLSRTSLGTRGCQSLVSVIRKLSFSYIKYPRLALMLEFCCDILSCMKIRITLFVHLKWLHSMSHSSNVDTLFYCCFFIELKFS